MKQQILNWQELSADDFIARTGCYVLRAEQMDTDFCWWSVYCKGEEIGSSMFSDEPATTR